MRDPESYLDHRLLVYRNFYSANLANQLFQNLQDEIEWLSPSYTNPDGTVVHLPRLTANYGDKSYNYSGLEFEPQPWTELLLPLKADAEKLSGTAFNALIIQFYRDGNDRVNWHSDDDLCVGKNPVIVSMSFGETRSFWFRNKDNSVFEEILKLELDHGDVVIMQGNLQHTHKHKVPREPEKGGRINLTFRKVII